MPGSAQLERPRWHGRQDQARHDRMTGPRPRHERLASWSAQRNESDEIRFTSSGGWQLPPPVTEDAVADDASPPEVPWFDGLGGYGPAAGVPDAGVPDAGVPDADVPDDYGLGADSWRDDELEPGTEAEVWWPGLQSRRNAPSDTVELDLPSGWAALGFDDEHGIWPITTPEPVATPEKPAGRFSGIKRRFGWGLADQAVSSLTNFAVSLYVARSLGPTQLGAFSLAYVTYAFVLNASRGLATDPLLVRFSGVEQAAWRRAVTSCTGTALGVGMLAGASMLGAAALLHGTARVAFLAIGLTMPGLMLQDSWRYAFFALGRGSQAFLNDIIWALVMVAGLLYLHASGNENVFWFILVWGSAATVAAAVGPLQARVVPRLLDAWKWVSEHRDLAFRYLTANTSNSGSAQLRAYGLGALAGLTAVGYLQAANLLMGPFLVVLMGISMVTVPEAARVLRNSPRHLRLYCLLLSCAVAVAALAWSGAILVLLPRGLGHLVLRSRWRPTYPLVAPLTLAIMAQCFCDGAAAGLRALGVAQRSLRAQLIQSATFVVFALLGAAKYGAIGALGGSAAATILAAVVWWWHLRAALRDAGLNSPAAAAGRHRMPGASRRAGVDSHERSEDGHAW